MKMRFRYLGQVNCWNKWQWKYLYQNFFAVKTLDQDWSSRKLITVTILGVILFFEVPRK